MNTSIKSDDISVVIQGPIDENAPFKILKSVKKYLPNAEIIFSTWENSNIERIRSLCDAVLVNKDPGAVTMVLKKETLENNLNRQILSTQSGIEKASRRYTLKLRSDLVLTSDKFLKYFDMFQERGSEYNLFERKILTSCVFTRHKYRKHRKEGDKEVPFHISDWWFFGLTSDLKTYLLKTPLTNEPDFTNYFMLKENQDKESLYGGHNFKFSPEQYIAYQCFARNFDDIYMQDCSDISNEIIEKSKKCIINNFTILEFKQSGIYLSKYLYSKNEKFLGHQYLNIYNFFHFENEYKKYCNNDYKITASDKFFKNKESTYTLLKLYGYLFLLFDKNSRLSTKIEKLFLGIPFATIKYLSQLIKQTIKTKH